MKIKKLIAVCLTIVMVCTMICIPAFASSVSFEYETDEDSYILNESYGPDFDAFMHLGINSVAGNRFFNIPLSVVYPSPGDPFFDVTLDSNYADLISTSFDLGFFDLTQSPSISLTPKIYIRLPAGSYQFSSHLPALSYSFSINDKRYDGHFSVYWVSVDGSLRGEFGYNSSGSKEVFNLTLDTESIVTIEMRGSLDYRFPSSEVCSQRGTLNMSVSPLYMYIGEPLEDGLLYPPPAPIKDFMGNVSTIFHNVINWVALTAETIVSNPLILIFSIVPYIGLGVSIYARIKRTKK